MARVAVTQPLYIYSAGPTSAPIGTDAVQDDCGDDPASQNPAD